MTAQVLVKLSAKLAAEQRAAKLKQNELAQLQFESDLDLSDLEGHPEGAILGTSGTDGISNGASSMFQNPKHPHIEKSNSIHRLTTG